MAFVAAGMAVAGASGLAGAYLQYKGTEDAANMQAQAAQNALDFQKQQYNDQAPWRQAGQQALSDMQNPYFQQTFSGQGMMEDDPGYQFRLNQGLQALQASAAARGGLMSGNTGEALQQYGQDYASNEYQNAYNRFTNNQNQRFNRLASLAGLGQTANAQAMQSGENMANTMMSGANAQAGARIAQGQIMGNTLSGLGNNFMQYEMMNKYMSPGGGTPGAYTPMDYSNQETGNPAGPALPNGMYNSADAYTPAAGPTE